MNVVRCKNGHFFDGDSYELCPHCGEVVLNNINSEPEKKEKKGFWELIRKDKKSLLQSEKNIVSDIDNSLQNAEDFTCAMSFENIQGQINSSENGDLTLAVCTDSFVESDVNNISNTREDVDVCVKTVEDTMIKKDNEVDKNEINEHTDISSPLVVAVKNASASNEGKTMSYFNSATSASSSQSSVKCINEPVVGWLVCVFGEHFGECFSIYAGKNSIGRSTDNRIVIPNDNSISRVKHALIVYEPKKRNFYLQPGDSSGLTYLNDDYITDSKKLNLYDSIELGESKFIFISLCGENFSWEDYMPKGE